MTATASEFPYGPPGVETGIVRQALPWTAGIVPVALAVGWLAAGTNGLISAAIGCALGIANLYASAFVLERAARRGTDSMMMVTLGSFFVRLIVLTAIFLGLEQLPFIDVTVLGLVLIATYVALLILESVTVVRADRAANTGAVIRRSGSRIDRSDDKEDA